MRSIISVAALIFMLSTTVALAQQSPAPTAAPSAQTNPCKRGNEELAIGGQDLQEAACRDALVGQIVSALGKQLAEQQVLRAEMQARILLLEQDKERLQKQVADLQKAQQPQPKKP